MSKTKFRLTVTGALSVLVLVLSVVLWRGEHSDAYMRGELSLKHSGLGSKCDACHNPWKGVDDAKCAACHAKIGEHLPDTASEKNQNLMKTARCSVCHTEHGGVNTSIKSVSADKCRRCHATGAHPGLKTAKSPAPPQAISAYPHGIHISKPIGMEKCYLCHVYDDDAKKLTLDPNVKDASICVGCHPGKFDAAPPVIHEQEAIHNKTFKHEKHTEAKLDCLDCHGNLSEPIANPVEKLPSVSTCMGCHGKPSGAFGCVKCHGFHAAQS